MKKIGEGRYIDTKLVIAANIYEKGGKTRVALQTSGTRDAEGNLPTFFSDEFETKDKAENFILNLK